jgi:hypothetical protein
MLWITAPDLIDAAVKLVIANKRKNTLMMTLSSLASAVSRLLPIDIDATTLREIVKEAVSKKCKIIKLHDRVGNDTFELEVVLFYSTMDELIEQIRKGFVDPIINVVIGELVNELEQRRKR